MKKSKKFFSTLIAASMLLSSLPVIGANAESSVIADKNGNSLNGLKDLPLSFTQTVTFSSPVADGTDLTGITLKAGDTTITPTVTQGALTTDETTGTSTFTEATVTMPLLDAGEEYTLSVPSIGDNVAADFSFTTVSDPYVVKEEIDGSFSADIYWNGNFTSVVKSNALKDTDNDGTTDSLYFNGYYHPTINFPQAIIVDNMSEITYEMRVKFVANKSNHKNSDGTINASTDSNNGGLFRMYGASGSSQWARIRTNASGEMTYGNTNGDAVNSGYKIYEDTWYTIRTTLSENRKQMKVYICNDNGDYYSGDWSSTSYNGAQMVSLSKVSLPYGSFIYS